VAHLFRLWGKKRGSRRTGSKLLGGVGEALFFASLLLIGTVSLAVLITSQILAPRTGGLDGSTLSLMLWGIFGSAFVLIGGGGVAYSVLHATASAERRSVMVKQAGDIELLSDSVPPHKLYPTIPRDANLTNSPGVKLAFRLPISYSPTWIFLPIVVLWITAIGAASVYSVWAIDSRRLFSFLTLVAITLVIAAIAITYCFVRSLVQQIILGPTTLEISDHPLYPGEQYQVFVSQAGHSTIAWLQLRIVCEEQATYQQGTNVRTETQTICSQPIFRQDDFRINPGMPFEHQCDLRVPAEAMHSFKSESNGVNWRLVVRGSAAGWPDFERTFPIIVYPCRNN